MSTENELLMMVPGLNEQLVHATVSALSAAQAGDLVEAKALVGEARTINELIGKRLLQLSVKLSGRIQDAMVDRFLEKHGFDDWFQEMLHEMACESLLPPKGWHHDDEPPPTMDMESDELVKRFGVSVVHQLLADETLVKVEGGIVFESEVVSS